MLSVALEPINPLINAIYLAALWAAVTAMVALRIRGSARRKFVAPPGDLEITSASIIQGGEGSSLKVVVVNRGPGAISGVSDAQAWTLVIGEEVVGHPEGVEAEDDVLQPGEFVTLVWSLERIMNATADHPIELIALFGPSESFAVCIPRILQASAPRIKQTGLRCFWSAREFMAG